MRDSHPELHPVVAEILAQHERAERNNEMETVPRLAHAPASRFASGMHVGPFRLLAPLGRGGMGEVWLADQVDGRIKRRLALKLPTALEPGDLRGERFTRERDILARLQHPNIARLYDAGIADSGQPWLAMEYIEGEALDEHATRRSLPLDARLGLMRQVLGAVGHAHRHLVVHRDLKPANILVDASGQVKLLDFGIAKLLADDATPGPQRDITRLGGRVMTLRYAAPEQVTAGEITTATDVYALGVLLHELVTGRSPYRSVRDGKPFTEVALLNEDVATPSSLAPVPRDLDAIVLKALRRDPAKRYASVNLLDDDLQRHLESRPVLARAGTWRYLAGRFALRHRLPIATAATLIITLAAGLFVAERERRVAVSERERAERHFGSVRRLANRMIMEVHGALEDVPGSLKAREALVQISLEYLDSLLGESGGDPQLMSELARAYLRIARTQGQVGDANLGEAAAAFANLAKGKRLFAELDRVRPDDQEILREHSTLRFILARMYFVQSDPRWREEIAASVKLAERAAALPSATSRERSRLALLLAEQAQLLNIITGIDPAIEAAIARAVALQEALLHEAPGDLDVRRMLAQTYTRAAKIFSDGNRTPETVRRTIDYHRKALETFRSVLQESPGDLQMISSELEISRELALALSAAGEHAQARSAIEDVERRLTALRDADLDDVEIVMDQVKVHTVAALIGHRAGDVGRTITHGRQALALVAGLSDEMRRTRDPVVFTAKAKAYLGFGLYAAAQDPGLDRGKRLALLREAQPLLGEAHAFLLQVLAQKLGTYDEGDGRELGDTLRRSGEEIRRLERVAPS